MDGQSRREEWHRLLFYPQFQGLFSLTCIHHEEELMAVELLTLLDNRVWLHRRACSWKSHRLSPFSKHPWSIIATPLHAQCSSLAQDPQVFIHLQGPILQPLSLLRFFHILFLPDLCWLKASVIIGVTTFSCFMRNSALYSLQFSFFKSCYFFFPTIVVI